MDVLDDNKLKFAKQVMALSQELKDLRDENQRLKTRIAESQERADGYRDLVNNINETLYRVDIQGNITYLSPSVEAMTGYKPEEIVGKRFSEYIQPEHMEVAKQHFKNVLSGGSTGSEYRLIRKDGDYIWVKSSSRPLFADGQVIGLQGTLTDITERKKAQDALRESEEHLRAIFDAVSDSIFIKDRDLTYVQVNRAMENLFGRPADQLLGATDTELFGTEAAEYIRAQDQKVLAGEVLEIENTKPVNGGETIFHVVKTPLRDNSGQVIGVCGVARDITKRRRALEALAESEEKFRQLAENVREVFWLGSPDWSKVYYVSPAYEEVWGRSCQSLYDNPLSWQEAVHPADRELVIGEIEKRIKGQESDPVFPEYRVLKPDGSVRWISARAFPILDAEGNIYRIAGIAEDVTQRREAESHIATLVASMVVATSQAFFDRTVEKICQWLDCEICLVGELADDGKVVIRGMQVDGEKRHSFSYELAGTPCEQVIKHGMCFYPSNVADLFPDDQGLVKLGAESYVGVPLKDDQGEVIGVVCALSRSPLKLPERSEDVLSIIAARAAAEVTRLRAEERARQSQDMLAKAFLASPAWVAVTTLDEGRYMLVNEAFTRITGYSQEETFGRTTLDLGFYLDPRDREDALGLFRKQGRLRNHEIELRFKDGSVHHLLWSAEPIDYQGEKCWINIFTDITNRKRTELALQRSEATLRSIYQAAPIGIGMVYGDKRMLGWCNERICEMTGYSVDELMGMPASNLYESQEEYLRVGREKHADVREHGVGSIQTRFRRKDGTSFDVLLSSAQTNPEDFNAGLVFTIMDITDQIRMQQEKELLAGQLRQAQKMEAIGTLAGGIAHDFNNILGAVMGYAELAMEDIAEGLVCIFEMEQVIKAAERGRELVKEILTFSRKGTTNLTELDLNHEIMQTVRLLKRTLPKMVGIKLDLASELMKIKGDSTQLEQVLMNLGTNAHHAMPEGGEIHVSTRNVVLDEEYCRQHMEIVPGRYVMLTFADNGQGMDEETLSKIFDPFFTTKDVGKGTGLGMSTLYGIVKGHSGHVTVNSELGVGTTFYLYFPALEDLAESPGSSIEDSRKIKGGGESILLVDDEAALRDVGEQILTRKGYSVMTASSGEEALDVYRRRGGEIDLVLLDVGMPGMGGDQCLQRLMEIDPAVRVIIASGYSRNDRLLNTLGAGAKGYVPKPYRRDDMLLEVRRVLDQAPNQAEGAAED